MDSQDRIGKLIDVLSPVRRPIIIAINLILVGLAYFLSFFLRFEGKIPENYLILFWQTLPVILVIKGTVFYFLGLYHGIWRYVSTEDLLNIFKAIVISSSIFVAFIVLVYGHGFPRSIFISDGTFCLIFLGGARFIVRLYRESKRNGKRAKGSLPNKNVLIVGAGQAGVTIKNEIKNNILMGYAISGFIDDSREKAGSKVQGIPVLGVVEDIPAMASAHEIKEIIIAIPSATEEQMKRIYDACRKVNIKPKSLPPLHELISGNLVRQIKDVEPEDFLFRERVDLDLNIVTDLIKDKTIFITGGGGTIGRELAVQAAKFDPVHIILLDKNENELYFTQLFIENNFENIRVSSFVGNILDENKLRHIISEHKPEIIYHAAAHKHVPLMEVDPAEAVLNNVAGTRKVINVSLEQEVPKVVLISTDKAVNPISVMGATKRICELMFWGSSNDKTTFIPVRFGNVLGSNGSLIPILTEQIKRGGPITITHPDMERYFMSISEAVQLVLQASAVGSGGAIYVLDMGTPKKIIDIAHKLIEFSGLTKDEIEIKIIGIRPGEKILEELWSEKEEVKPTAYPKLLSINGHSSHNNELFREIDTLVASALTLDAAEVISNMRAVVPEYEPSDYSRDKWGQKPPSSH